MAMHVEVSRAVIRSLLKSSCLVARPNDARPILRNVKLQSVTDGLYVISTDTVVSLRFFIPVGDALTVLGEGAVVAVADDMCRVFDEMRSDTVLIQDTGSRCAVNGGGTKYSLVIEDARDFPQVSLFSDAAASIRIKSQTLKEVFARTAYCAHGERSFYLMHGLDIKCEDSTLVVAATDGRRLAVARCAVDEDPDRITGEIIIPAETVGAISKVFGDGDEMASLQWTDRTFNIKGTKGCVSVLALRGNFPDYKRGIPNNTKVIEFDRAKLIELMRQTKVFKSANTSLVTMDISKEKIVLRAGDPTMGEFMIEHDVSWEHDPMSLVVNPEFIHQTASASRGQTILFELETPMVQTLLREKRDGGFDSFCVYAVARL